MAPATQEAEHAAANLAVQFLRAQDLLHPLAGARGGGGPRQEGLCAITPVGSKRSKDADEEDAGVSMEGGGGKVASITEPSPHSLSRYNSHLFKAHSFPVSSAGMPL